ncbi:cell division protein FtsA [Candidatus Uhrbacteria bacterium]|nr:cell division protein FtsA [Candidatus Uhrbacteria bacterium]
MPNDELFAGIDIGTTAVRVAVGQRLPMGDRETVHIIGVADHPTEGVKRGVINSIEDAVSSVSACLEKAERGLGSQISSAWVGVSGNQVSSVVSKGVTAVSRTDGEIREEDVERALQQAQTVALPANFETIHVLPRAYSVDGQTGIKDPVGMTGIRLEVESQIIQAPTPYIKNLTKCVYRTGINLEQTVLGILAAAEVTVSQRQKELGVAVVNIGHSSTSMAVFEGGDLLHLASVPIGSDHVTADLAIGLRTTLDIAERIKVGHASAVPGQFDKNDRIDLMELGADEREDCSLKFVAQIVQARLEELLEKIDREMVKVGRSGMLPAGVVMTGGGSKTAGLVDLAKRKLRLPVSLGYPVNITSYTDRVNDLSYTTAIGLVQWGINESGPMGKSGSFAGFRMAEKAVGRIKGLFGVRT